MSHHWQNALKFDKRSKKLRLANSAAAENFMARSGLSQ